MQALRRGSRRPGSHLSPSRIALSRRRLLKTLLPAVASSAAPGWLPGSAARAQSPAAGADFEERTDIARLFQAKKLQGTFVVLDPGGAIYGHDRDRAARRLSPASTFKIPNSLIALEAGVVKDENEVIPFEGPRNPMFPQWERDMSMRDAIRLSNVPIYQLLARRIGPERYRDWLARLDYGNRDIGSVVDRFWLDGPLAISAVEEVRFAAKLSRDELPARVATQAKVRNIVRLEHHNGAALYGKTGWAASHAPNVGWLIGWVERGSRTTAFALNIDMAGFDQAPLRLELAKACLARLGVYS